MILLPPKPGSRRRSRLSSALVANRLRCELACALPAPCRCPACRAAHGCHTQSHLVHRQTPPACPLQGNQLAALLGLPACSAGRSGDGGPWAMNHGPCAASARGCTLASPESLLAGWRRRRPLAPGTACVSSPGSQLRLTSPQVQPGGGYGMWELCRHTACGTPTVFGGRLTGLMHRH